MIHTSLTNTSHLSLDMVISVKSRAPSRNQSLPQQVLNLDLFNQAMVFEKTRSLSHNHLTQIALVNHSYNYLSKTFLNLQRYGTLMRKARIITIYRDGARERISHTFPYSKLHLSHQSLSFTPFFRSRMSRYADRVAIKRNSSLNLDPIVIDAFDNSDLLVVYDLTLVGRVLNTDLQAHRVRALLALMPQAWQLEVRVHGVEAGRGKFHFRFNRRRISSCTREETLLL